MEKEKLRLPYEEADLAILRFSSCDVITTSGNYGSEGDDNQGWT